MDELLCADPRAIPRKMLEPACGLRSYLMSTTYPCSPSTTMSTESDLPRRLKRLEVLIWLEESFDRQGVDDSERQESTEDEQPLGGAGDFCGLLWTADFLGRSHDLIETLLYFSVHHGYMTKSIDSVDEVIWTVGCTLMSFGSGKFTLKRRVHPNPSVHQVAPVTSTCIIIRSITFTFNDYTH